MDAYEMVMGPLFDRLLTAHRAGDAVEFARLVALLEEHATPGVTFVTSPPLVEPLDAASGMRFISMEAATEVPGLDTRRLSGESAGRVAFNEGWGFDGEVGPGGRTSRELLERPQVFPSLDDTDPAWPPRPRPRRPADCHPPTPAASMHEPEVC